MCRDPKAKHIDGNIDDTVLRRGGGSTHHSIMSYHERLLTHIDGLRATATEQEHVDDEGDPSALFALFPETEPEMAVERAMASDLGRLVGAAGQSVGVQVTQFAAQQVMPPSCPYLFYIVFVIYLLLLCFYFHRMLICGLHVPFVYGF